MRASAEALITFKNSFYLFIKKLFWEVVLYWVFVAAFRLSLVAVQRLLMAAASLLVEHGL